MQRGINMSHAIIRNAKYKMANMQSVSRHNERQNKEYGNEDIDIKKKDLNYHLKEPQENSYEKEFERLKEENQLKGNLRLTGKKQSNVACEFLITSDNDFFKKIGQAETKRYFKEAYQFACDKCGEKNIISAVVHMDETTPHMHLTYIPVVKGTSRKGQPIEKINCSEFWKGFNSYGELQDKFYDHMKGKGFDLERGQKNEDREQRREHLSVQKYKEETLQEQIKSLEVEKEEAKNLLNQIDEKINKLHNEEYRSKTQLEINHRALQEVERVKVSYAEVEAIEGKLGAFKKGKVIISQDEFIKLKDAAKKVYTLEYRMQNLQDEITRLRIREDRMEKLAKSLKDENKDLKLRSKALSEEINVYKRVFKKGGLSEEQFKQVFKQAKQELYVEEKAKAIEVKKTRNYSMNMGR